MAQTYNITVAPAFLDAKNEGVSVASGETILFDKLPFGGFYNGSVTIYSTSGTATVVSVYGSADGIKYYTINATLISSIAANVVKSGSFAVTAKYIRVTATGTSTVDAYVNAVPA
jgi:hypothetical protein